MNPEIKILWHYSREGQHDWGKSKSKFTNLPCWMILSMSDSSSPIVVAACLSGVDRFDELAMSGNKALTFVIVAATVTF